MTEYTEKKCPECGQRLRIPKHIGGMLMSCPSCGKKFHSDFKLGGARQSAAPPGLFTTIFELPYKIMSRIAHFFLPK
ncbi:zinc ribbon domain-containing protein [Desulfopila sp. IMCC35008]|uniref:zinc ribbon domain-containing protein n=1 Tax=Desulfopila sp. IMCC35008 TaxID=2653858 RepID=UPI0013D32C29